MHTKVVALSAKCTMYMYMIVITRRTPQDKQMMFSEIMAAPLHTLFFPCHAISQLGMVTQVVFGRLRNDKLVPACY